MPKILLLHETQLFKMTIIGVTKVLLVTRAWLSLKEDSKHYLGMFGNLKMFFLPSDLWYNFPTEHKSGPVAANAIFNINVHSELHAAVKKKYNLPFCFSSNSHPLLTYFFYRVLV